ncbi:MAG TPA: Flp pilus assembly protein CpaB [Terriglobales bacterium]|nr:Flp pilus assembly protein CpaB [Terriglobales bacterium]HXY48372.1 Flp pilus assembly protein CpaB [Terriglobales bacterium]
MRRTWLLFGGFLALALGMVVSQKVLRAPQTKRELIRPNKLAANSGWPGLIPPGMRAVSVRVNDQIAEAGFVVPGTRVNVLLTNGPRGINKRETTTVLENVVVIAAGQRLERNSVEEPQKTFVVTLLVSPSDAEKLTAASSKGQIQLMLRNRFDHERPRQWDTPLKPIPPEIPPSLRVTPIPPETPLNPTLNQT